jgi:hypothetical protein
VSAEGSTSDRRRTDLHAEAPHADDEHVELDELAHPARGARGRGREARERSCQLSDITPRILLLVLDERADCTRVVDSRLEAENSNLPGVQVLVHRVRHFRKRDKDEKKLWCSSHGPFSPPTPQPTWTPSYYYKA